MRRPGVYSRHLRDIQANLGYQLQNFICVALTIAIFRRADTMRLLNTSTYKLSEFFGDQTPKYAILSHTWGQEEIEYNDLASGNFMPKEGFFKLHKCCQQAFSNGYTYVWIDTCCIDKSSSAELSEAINSMCRWYENAEVCYAFLEDVGRGDPYDSNSEFRRSRWFTRGWTLQELLFSQVVKFYDKLWQEIDFHTHPSARSELLSEITNIHPLALEDVHYAFCLPAATRISWASKRNTTRVEDMAYCLIGLLQVNLPLLYGEGDRAFVRLQREVISHSRDTSVLAWGIGQPWGDIISHTQVSYVLGRSPADFRHAFRFSPNQPSPKRIRTGDELHFMYTNAGLRIQLPILFVWETYIALAFLESVWPRKLEVRNTHSSKAVTSSTFHVAIPLERTKLGVYRRLQGCMPFYAPESLRGKARSQQIYLQDTTNDDWLWRNVLSYPTGTPLVHIDISELLKEGYKGISYFPPKAIALDGDKSRLVLMSEKALMLFRKDEKLPTISLLVSTRLREELWHWRELVFGRSNKQRKISRVVESGITLIGDDRSPLECLLCSICGRLRSHRGGKTKSSLDKFQWREKVVLPEAQGSRLLCSRLVLVAGQPTVDLSFYPYSESTVGDVWTPLSNPVHEPWMAVHWDNCHCA